MEKIIVLGTGCASVTENFNTCFLLENCHHEYLMVDTGGGNGILRQLKKCGVPLSELHHIFISHKHIDHLYGLLWIYRSIDILMSKGEYEGTLNIYCNDEVAGIIRNQIFTLLRKVQQRHLDEKIFIHVVHDHEKIQVLNYELEILDIKAKSDLQYGFKTVLEQGQTLLFHGDEPLYESLFQEATGVDYLLHEAFCLETEADRFHPREKNHDTVASIGMKAEKLGVKNLILWHTHENLGDRRKECYRKEAKESFRGNIYVPNDLEVIELK